MGGRVWELGGLWFNEWAMVGSRDYYLQNAQRILEIIVFDVSGKMLKSVENLHNAHQFPKISIMRTTVNTLLRFSIFMVFSLGYRFYYSHFLSKYNTCDIYEKVLRILLTYTLSTDI